MILVSTEKTESNQQLIYGIINGDRQILENIYDEHFQTILGYITKNSGTYDDAKDVFQESLIIIFHNFRKDNFKLECKFSTYLFSICKNIWLKHLRDKSCQKTDINNIIDIIPNQDFSDSIREARCYDLYQKKFDSLSEACKSMLRMYFAKIDMKSIAKSMNLSSESYAKKKKFKCKEYLTKIIKEELLNKNLLSDE